MASKAYTRRPRTLSLVREQYETAARAFANTTSPIGSIAYRVLWGAVCDLHKELIERERAASIVIVFDTDADTIMLEAA